MSKGEDGPFRSADWATSAPWKDSELQVICADWADVGGKVVELHIEHPPVRWVGITWRGDRAAVYFGYGATWREGRRDGARVSRALASKLARTWNTLNLRARGGTP